METEPITDLMAALILQLGIILFAVRFLGRLARRIKIYPVLGELLAGIIIGPYALGGSARVSDTKFVWCTIA